MLVGEPKACGLSASWARRAGDPLRRVSARFVAAASGDLGPHVADEALHHREHARHVRLRHVEGEPLAAEPCRPLHVRRHLIGRALVGRALPAGRLGAQREPIARADAHRARRPARALAASSFTVAMPFSRSAQPSPSGCQPSQRVAARRIAGAESAPGAPPAQRADSASAGRGEKVAPLKFM